MTQSISVTLSKTITYVSGKVNDVAAEFTYVGDGVWSTTADKAENGRYAISITATDSQGVSCSYYTVKYYGVYLITDRTQADLENDTAKAYIDFEDLNRVEGAVKFISDRLAEAGYSHSITPRVEWTMEDIRTQADMDRLRDNINALRTAFSGLYPSTPTTPESITYSSIDQANDIEQILADLDELETNMELDYRYSAEPISGEEITL